MPLLHLQSSTSIQGISSSHPNQNWLEQAVSLHSVVSQWDWAYQGHIKTHNGCACWSNGVMVLTQMMCLEDLVSTAVPWCHPTAVLWAWEHEWSVLLLFPFVQCICWIYSVLLCVTYHTEKPVTSKQFLSCSPSDYFGKQTYSNIADNVNV